MSATYQTVQWNPFKRRYDLLLAASVIGYLALFYVCGKLRWGGDHGMSDEILILRGLATAAFILLNIILCIGPLARLDVRFLPLLYNRRHLGVTAFLLGLLHAVLATGYYHGFGVTNPILSVLTANTQYRSISAFPFETLGLIALAILFVMAATSHDFWLKNLSPAIWKGIHMLVYPAWGLLVLHVALGALQAESNPLYFILLLTAVALVSGLHIAAGWVQSARERHPADANAEVGWMNVGTMADLFDGRAVVVNPEGAAPVAIFRHGKSLSAVASVCAHQGGPLGEGRIIDGCITCPWHGFQYRPRDGCAPPPFTEKLPTYRLRLRGDLVQLNTDPLPPGTPVEPLILASSVEVPRG